jgi:hypothetical protein
MCGARQATTPEKSNRPKTKNARWPFGHRAGWEFRVMLLIAGRTGSNAQIILGLEQSDLNAFQNPMNLNRAFGAVWNM